MGALVLRPIAAKRLAVALTASLVLTACGGSDDTGGESTPPPTADGTAPGTDAPDDPAPDDVAPSGTLTFGMRYDPVGLEPVTMSGGVADGYVGRTMFDALTIVDPSTGELTPFLAESVETDDNVTFNIRLREGITFHDGTPLDAEAVEFNLLRHADPENTSRFASTAAAIETIELIDSLEVALTLTFPWAAFPEILAGPLGMMASPTAIADAGDDFGQNPVGTGPFRFEQWTPGDRVEFAYNPDYWRPGQPKVERVIFRVIPDSAVSIDSVRNGEIDAAIFTEGNAFREAEQDGLQVSTTFGTPFTFMMNNAAPPFDDVRARRAIAFGTDLDVLNQVTFDGTLIPSKPLIPPASEFVDDSVEWPEYDPEQARALVEEYEADHGSLTFTWTTGNDAYQVRNAELAGEMWRAIGIDVEIDVMDTRTLIDSIYSGNYQLGNLAIGSSRDPDQAYFHQLHSEGSSNRLNFANDDFDAALEIGRASTDIEERREAYGTIQSILAEEVPVWSWGSSPWGWIVGPGVEGLDVLPDSTFLPGLVSLGD